MKNKSSIAESVNEGERVRRETEKEIYRKRERRKMTGKKNFTEVIIYQSLSKCLTAHAGCLINNDTLL